MRPIAFFDLETTGTDVVADRIVQIHITKVNPVNWEIIDQRAALINPEIPISPEATAVHGITNETVKDKPKFGQLAKGILEFMMGCDVGGFNIINFDVPILNESFLRSGYNWPAPGTLFFDSYKIFAEKEQRNLTGAVKFYLNEVLEGAHDAGNDVAATINVFKAQINRYEDLKEMTLAELHTFCVGANTVDLAGKLIRNQDGVVVYGFGKDKGKGVKDNPGFAYWMMKQSFPTDTINHIKKILFGK